MKRMILVVLASGLCACSNGVEEQPASPDPGTPAAGRIPDNIAPQQGVGVEGDGTAPEVPDEGSPYVLSHTMNRIDGTPESLEAYKGKVVLIVNVASRCGLTPQYESLQTLYDAYEDRGLVVLGFPANQFNDQEPGTNAQITRFCTESYGVSFPMFEKTVVKGEGTCPLYRQLSELTAEPGWNFTKYLVDREGNLVDRIDPQTDPTDPQVVARIEALLRG